MIKRLIFFYILVVTIPLFLGLLVWQSTRYQNLTRELTRLEQAQSEWIESNKKLIASVGEYSSPERIGDIARNQFNLQRIQPEYMLQVRIIGGKGHEFY